MKGRRDVIPGAIKRLTPSQLEALIELFRAGEDGITIGPANKMKERLLRLKAYGYASQSTSDEPYSPGKRLVNHTFKITSNGRFRLLEPMKLLGNG